MWSSLQFLVDVFSVLFSEIHYVNIQVKLLQFDLILVE